MCERRNRIWAWWQSAERIWAVWYLQGWVGVEWEMCEWEGARRRQARWMQEAMHRRQWLAQARWLGEIWQVAFGAPSSNRARIHAPEGLGLLGLPGRPSSAGTGASQPSAIDPSERRIANNGIPYTAQEFQNYYGPSGWLPFWNRAQTAPELSTKTEQTNIAAEPATPDLAHGVFDAMASRLAIFTGDSAALCLFTRQDRREANMRRKATTRITIAGSVAGSTFELRSSTRLFTFDFAMAVWNIDKAL